GYVRTENMAAARGSVWIPYDHVRMYYRLPLIERDVTAHPDHFMLTLNGNLLVHFSLAIEPRQRCTVHSSDSDEMCARNVILLREFLQSGKGLVSMVEDDRILLCLITPGQQLKLHLGSFALRTGLRRRDIVSCGLLCVPH